ncbi:MAG: SBBP repeat-containing protein [candidate division WOR-3 bacterium]|nr:MAG: SBBP repeat-containing protein [candidate division WOR-3 bacterium]
MLKKLCAILCLIYSTALFAQVDTAWVRTYNGPGNGGDYARAMAVDTAGNVYVTGNSATNPNWPYDHDYVTIKYNSAGVELWVSRYIGPGDPGNNDDYALAIALDGEGNVYVTGHSPGPGAYDDIATIKYYPDGDTAWVRRYNGPANDVDAGYAIAVDAEGNVYVTGHSYDPAVSDDYVTIKYNSDGDELWVTRYNGAGDGGDYARAIALDEAGNVYITGWTFGGWPPAGMEDYTTIKYTQQPGVAENDPQNIPARAFLSQNFPNPFKDLTQINYGVPHKTAVNISIYNAAGQCMKTLVDDVKAPGFYKVSWNGTDNMGRSLAMGIYFLRMTTDESIEITKLIQIR